MDDRTGTERDEHIISLRTNCLTLLLGYGCFNTDTVLRECLGLTPTLRMELADFVGSIKQPNYYDEEQEAQHDQRAAQLIQV